MTTPPRRTRAASHYLNVKMAQVRQSIMILAKQRAQLEERDQITPKDLRDALGFLLPAPPNTRLKQIFIYVSGILLGLSVPKVIEILLERLPVSKNPAELVLPLVVYLIFTIFGVTFGFFGFK